MNFYAKYLVHCCCCSPLNDLKSNQQLIFINTTRVNLQSGKKMPGKKAHFKNKMTFFSLLHRFFSRFFPCTCVHSLSLSLYAGIKLFKPIYSLIISDEIMTSMRLCSLPFTFVWWFEPMPVERYCERTPVDLVGVCVYRRWVRSIRFASFPPCCCSSGSFSTIIKLIVLCVCVKNSFK